ncbi:ABC transporter permease [Neobacillus drentensis]|uniref:FtsX-like permease family protein n=1 Tax=Neobacillus drentensis TaxID=220684 RepID=UPI001F19129F|nr:ABC transporter permease [Neobacillus drentensis]ULT54592.1 ABC transporter permease [Neobacillus drentensis]
MTLFSLARKNILKNLRQYVIYLYSMIISISIYFTFVSLQYNEQLISSSVTRGKLEPAFQAAAVILIVFSAIFIWYSNAFFTKKRKKEVGLYALFGMSKKKIGQLLFYENLIMGVFALFIGITVGLLFSKLFTMIIFKMMGFSLEAAFTIKERGLIQTTAVFLLITLLTSFQSYRLIYRFSLAELFKAEQKGESSPLISWLKSILSLMFIGSAYTLLLNPNDIVNNPTFRFVPAILLLMIGSYFAFSSLVALLLKLAQKATGFYLKGENLLSITNLFYRIKGNVLILTVISLLSSVTLIACITTYSLYRHLGQLTELNNPYSYMFNMKNEDVNHQLQTMIEKTLGRKILYKKKVDYLSIKADVSSLTRVPDFFQTMIISEKTYHELMKLRGITDRTHLGKNEAMAFYDGNLDRNSDPFSGKKLTLPANRSITITAYKDISLLNQGEMLFPLVISNSLYEELKQEGNPETLYMVKTSVDKTAEKLNANIEKHIKHLRYAENQPIFASFYEKYHYGLETYGLLIFIGIFLGLVFLLATGSMIYFKQLMEATNDKERYHILTKIGISDKIIKKSINKQLGLVFILPIILAVCNTGVILSILADFLQIDMVLPFILCFAVYVFIYLAYFWVTTRSYLKMIKVM